MLVGFVPSIQISEYFKTLFLNCFQLFKLPQATEAKSQLQLAENNKELKLILGDNGNGIPMEVLDGKVNGMGLGNLKSRVNYLNGRLEIQSSGLGTRISIWVPSPLEAEKEGTI